jgi:uncharacterized protein YbjQ (UPF0145 family)
MSRVAVAVIALTCGCVVLPKGRVDLEYANARAEHAVATENVVLTSDVAPYRHVILGDLAVRVEQITAFGRIPTRADVDAELRKRAAALGAHAVVLVRYSHVGVGASWHEIEGKGRAIRYY